MCKELSIRRVEVEVIFITAHVDESLRSRLIEDGAVECLFKPFSDQALVLALHAAIQVVRLN
jgi:FixJ family two-component response regulator